MSRSDQLRPVKPPHARGGGGPTLLRFSLTFRGDSSGVGASGGGAGAMRMAKVSPASTSMKKENLAAQQAQRMDCQNWTKKRREFATQARTEKRFPKLQVQV